MLATNFRIFRCGETYIFGNYKHIDNIKIFIQVYGILEIL